MNDQHEEDQYHREGCPSGIVIDELVDGVVLGWLRVERCVDGLRLVVKEPRQVPSELGYDSCLLDLAVNSIVVASALVI